MRQLLLVCVLAGVAALVVAALAAAATFRGIEPVLVSGKDMRGSTFDCSGYGASNSVKFEPPVNGASAGGITLLVPGPGDPGTITWYTEGGTPIVAAAIVKGGKNANAYIYRGSVDYPHFSDSGLHAPNKSATEFYDAGYILFCYNPA